MYLESIPEFLSRLCDTAHIRLNGGNLRGEMMCGAEFMPRLPSSVHAEEVFLQYCFWKNVLGCLRLDR